MARASPSCFPKARTAPPLSTCNCLAPKTPALMFRHRSAAQVLQLQAVPAVPRRVKHHHHQPFLPEHRPAISRTLNSSPSTLGSSIPTTRSGRIHPLAQYPSNRSAVQHRQNWDRPNERAAPNPQDRQPHRAPPIRPAEPLHLLLALVQIIRLPVQHQLRTIIQVMSSP